MSELPLLASSSPDSSSEPGWAAASLREFCAAPAPVQRAVLRISAVGEHDDATSGDAAATSEGGRQMFAVVAREVALCATQPWRTGHAHISDQTLRRVCLIFHLKCG